MRRNSHEVEGESAPLAATSQSVSAASLKARSPRFDRVCDLIQERLRRFLSKRALIALLFTALFLCASMALFAALFSKSSTLIALSLIFAFVVSFSYFIMRIYHQARSPEQLGGLRDEFIASARQMIEEQERRAQQHQQLAQMLTDLDQRLKGLETRLWKRKAEQLFSPLRPALAPLFYFLSALLAWRATHRFRQLLLLAAIDEQIKQVQCQPTDLRAHAALAQGYARLASIFNDPRKKIGADFFSQPWEAIPLTVRFERFEEKFLLSATRAIEQFKIISHFAPDDHWVHLQLAYCYRDLSRREDEIAEYEKILQLVPEDDGSRFRLGVLYFQEGRNADGLRIYELLLQRSYPKAHQLLPFYEAYRTAQQLDPFED